MCQSLSVRPHLFTVCNIRHESVMFILMNYKDKISNLTTINVMSIKRNQLDRV
ncbi:Uncharacterised protein [Yersinia frederiksenii]|jgi:hypothetical protein|uniref:Uncharacterized protein n=1 Tax=Yersinia frederiksenii TaxID=29484 RepID=A0AAI9EN36_YERFR|nr:Uncharacterised protein [Yersinia frederiksenii]CFR17594.1 Uncharacterised protein [Yersinia frederiksenii]CNF79868.1 Uncharacterised protein [Yersinia frederiksenii]CNL20548.1 Uncharacterised protein [Yersinia frederiksenii]CQH37917.1 Uncharacterised protein [Yersinia frederiksenii]